MVYFRWQLATSLQNFIYLRLSVVEILLFVQKSKMAVAELTVFDNAVYRFSISLFSLEIFAVKLENCCKTY